MSKEFMPRMFEPFSQAQSVFSAKTSGLGLGLALVKRMVEMQGGEVTVESDGPDRGPSFIVSLPLVAEPLPRISRVRGQNGSRRRIMVIEDNEDNCDTLRKLLELAGYEVESAGDGREGVERAPKFLPEIALVDLALPTWDGYEVARRLREKFGKQFELWL